ncbi:MAG: Fic family protein, partial [Alphaproteobacteria bacterium]
TDQVTDPVTDQVTDPVTDLVTDPVDRLLHLLQAGPLAPSQVLTAIGRRHRPTFKANYLRPALAEGLIEMTIPDKPRSSKQRYRLTEAGRARLRRGP